jgi:flagellar assembly protein FliH
MPALRLEDFGSPAAAGPAPANASVSEEELEAQRLAAFDRGYSAGWEDARKAAEQDAGRIRADFAAALRDMSFTFHEARAHVMRGLLPLLRAVTETILPRAVQATLALRLQEEIAELAEAAADRPVLLRTAPGESDALRDSVGAVPGLPLDLAEDDSVPPGQIFLILGRAEVNLDLTGPLARLEEALQALDNDLKEQLKA